MKLPEKYTIPEDRIPKPWSQGTYDCCVAASITKVLEVIEYVKYGTYTMLSKGYMYGRHNKPDKKQGGMDYDYVIPLLLERGTVPEALYPEMDEMPSIREKLENLLNIAELDKEAEKTKITGFIKIKGNVHFDKNVKECLFEHNMPLVGNMVGKRHCAVIVGWDGDKFLYHDHRGKSTLSKGQFNEAYFLYGERGGKMPFIDVKETDWFYEAVKYVYDNGIMQGTGTDTFAPNKALTRAEAATLIYRILSKGGEG